MSCFTPPTYSEYHGQEVHAQEEHSRHKATKVHQMMGCHLICHSGIPTHAGHLRIGRTAAEIYLIGGNRTPAELLQFHSNIPGTPNK